MSGPFDAYQRWLGIPPEEQPPNHYRLLGVEFFEDRAEIIEQAAQRRTAHIRTFQVGPNAELCRKLLQEVAAARLCLLKPDKKAAYDEFLRSRQSNQPGAAHAPAKTASPPPFPVAVTESGPADVELGELAEAAESPSSDPGESATCPTRRRWLGVGAAGLAALLLLGIAVLMGLLTWDSGHAPQTANAPPEPTLPEPAREAQKPLDEDSLDEADWWQSLVEALGEDDSPDPKEASRPSGPPAKTRQPSAASAATEPSPAKGPAEGKKPSEGKSPPEAAATMFNPSPPPAAPSQSAQPQAPAPKPPDLKPEPFRTDPRLDELVAQAWTCIRQRDPEAGRQRLLQAAKVNHDDLRVDFSLGLIDALITRDWPSAERHFQQCIQQRPTHAASLNNLALVRLRLNKENLSLKHWQTALGQGPAPAEIVQNLGRLRHLTNKSLFSVKPALEKTIGNLYAEAKSSGSHLFDPKVGFQYIGLYGGGNPDFGWRDGREMEDRWCVVCGGNGRMKCPKADCSHGMVTRMAGKFVGVNPLTKSPVYQPTTARIPCPTCRGSGWTSCTYCRNGKDKELLRSDEEKGAK